MKKLIGKLMNYLKSKKRKTPDGINNIFIGGDTQDNHKGLAEERKTEQTFAKTAKENRNIVQLDSFREAKKHGINQAWGKKKIILFSGLGFFVLLLLFTGVYALSIWNNPLSPFENAAVQAQTAAPSAEVQTETAVQSETDGRDLGEPADEGLLSQDDITPAVDPYAELISKSDLSILDKTVNIMLIGVDYAAERETWRGKHAYHADVMIVLAINTEKNEVHMISLPRDTYAKIPGVKGIYKLNASIDCGGGWPSEGGFNKVCEAASWMLGGIPVKYYYAVDMGAVKALVDMVGGLDYNIDINFTLQGRSYKAGPQHMDGQAVLDYFRVRKHLSAEDSGDLNRINRQKELLIAIYKKLKDAGLLVKLPELIGAFQGSLYTNTTLAQTGGLAAFAYKLGSDKIFMHSMDGKYANGIFNWNFVITDQEKRVQLIKEVYGIDVKPLSQYDYASAMALWNKMQNKVILSRAKSVLTRAKKILDADAALPEENTPPGTLPSPPPEQNPSPSPEQSQTTGETPSVSPEPAPDGTGQPTERENTAAGTRMTAKLVNVGNLAFAVKPGIKTPRVFSLLASGYRKYGSDVWALYYKCIRELSHPGELLKTDIEHLCSALSISKPNWRVNYEKESNQIYVDFN